MIELLKYKSVYYIGNFYYWCLKCFFFEYINCVYIFLSVSIYFVFDN